MDEVGEKVFDRTSTFVRIETALAAIIVIAAAAGVYLSLERADAREELPGLEKRYALAEDDLVALQQETALRTETVTRKTEELALRQEESKARETSMALHTLTPRSDALGLSARLIAFAAERDLALAPYEWSEGPVPVGQIEFPAISYSMVAKGTPGPLVGIVDIVGGVIAANIETLEIERDPDDTDLWIMKLDLVAPYREDSS